MTTKTFQGAKQINSEKVFHRDVYLPFPPHVTLTYLLLSRHAKERAREKGIRLDNLTPETLLEVIEVTIQGSSITKMLVRGSYDSHRDICIVFIPSLSGSSFIKTIWLNYKSDKHATLDKSKFEQRINT